MYVYTYPTLGQVSQGHAPNPTTFVPPPGFVATSTPVPVPVPIPSQITPPPPVQVPPSCHPIELAQFCRDDRQSPLHWAFFVRTAPPSSRTSHRSTTTISHDNASNNDNTPRGNFYELVGTSDTYTAQFFPRATCAPEMLPDWRGTHVIGWVHAGQVTAFERAVRQVQVWRCRPEWRSQQWAYDVVCALAGTRASGMYVQGWTFAGLQWQMTRLLEAWESGDI